MGQRIYRGFQENQIRVLGGVSGRLGFAAWTVSVGEGALAVWGAIDGLLGLGV